MTTSEMERGRIEAWNGATNQVSTRIREMLNPTNSVGAMSISGAAKGGHTTINQLAGMRGLMYRPQRPHHSDANPLELPRRPHHDGVLHLHPRFAPRDWPTRRCGPRTRAI